MENLGPARETQIVLGFLRAEIDPPRFQDLLRRQLRHTGTTRRFSIDHTNLKRVKKNARIDALRHVRSHAGLVPVLTPTP
jgi:hypothetical protein